MIGKSYLGDSVYAATDGYSIVLTTENGAEPSNTIVLEPEVLERLFCYRNRLNEAMKKPEPVPFNEDGPSDDELKRDREDRIGDWQHEKDRA